MLSSIAARAFPLHRHFSSSSLSFAAAQTLVLTLKSEPSNDVKLELYALFKQATVGANVAPRPSSFDYVAAAKWSAWRNVSALDRAEAAARYAALVAKLTGTAGAAPTAAAAAAAAAAPTAPTTALPAGTGLVYRAQLDAARGVEAVVLNAPPVNALGSRVLGELSAALQAAASDASVRAIVLASASAPNVFSGGLDIQEMANAGEADFARFWGQVQDLFLTLVRVCERKARQAPSREATQ
jgi:acyl-CoA-binding protein